MDDQPDTERVYKGPTWLSRWFTPSRRTVRQQRTGDSDGDGPETERHPRGLVVVKRFIAALRDRSDK